MRYFTTLAALFTLTACQSPEAPPAPTPPQIDQAQSPQDAAWDADFPQYYNSFNATECCVAIAHSGGGIDGNSYTNVREAMITNYNRGFRLFELDFMPTSDNKWVAVREWETWKMFTGYQGEGSPSRHDFLRAKQIYQTNRFANAGQYTSFDLPWLFDFVAKRPDVTIVVDTKTTPRLPQLVEAVANSTHADQFIYTGYLMSDIQMIRDIVPDARIILATYRLDHTSALVSEITQNKDALLGVSIPLDRALDDDILAAYVKTGVPVYVHGKSATINSRSLHDDLADKGVAGFYLD